MRDIIQKAPADVLDFDIDVSLWLEAGDSVDSAPATVADCDVVVDEVGVTTDRVKVWLSGGADGDSGTLTVLVTTAGGRTKELCYRLRVRDC